MALGDSVMAGECKRSRGTNEVDHLAAHGAGFAAGQVTIVAILQIDAHFLGSLHLELVHSLTSLGDIQLVVVLGTHNRLSPFY